MLQGMFSTALSLFIVMNSIGSSSLFLSLMKGIPKKRQKQIVLRELLIALFIIVLFHYIGQIFLNFFGITDHVVQIAGGVVLFLLSIKMLFPPEKEKIEEEKEFKKIKEPFIVPLAIPIIAGPALLAAVILYSHQQPNIVMLGSIIIAWVASLLILLLSAHLSDWLGERGLIAIERLMGFIMVLISIQMFLVGLKAFMKA